MAADKPAAGAADAALQRRQNHTCPVPHGRNGKGLGDTENDHADAYDRKHREGKSIFSVVRIFSAVLIHSGT